MFVLPSKFRECFLADFHTANENDLVDGIDSVCVPLEKFYAGWTAICLHKFAYRNNCSKTTGAGRMRQQLVKGTWPSRVLPMTKIFVLHAICCHTPQPLFFHMRFGSVRHHWFHFPIETIITYVQFVQDITILNQQVLVLNAYYRGLAEGWHRS